MDTQKQDQTMKASPFRKLVLAIALTAGALLASSTTANAQAPASPADPGVRCAAKIGPGEYEFYLPGAKVTDKDGNKWVCGPDGMWFRDYSSLTTGTPPLGSRVPTSLVSQVKASTIIR